MKDTTIVALVGLFVVVGLGITIAVVVSNGSSTPEPTFTGGTGTTGTSGTGSSGSPTEASSIVHDVSALIGLLGPSIITAATHDSGDTNVDKPGSPAGSTASANREGTTRTGTGTSASRTGTSRT